MRSYLLNRICGHAPHIMQPTKANMLVNILQHAGKHIPYYRDKFASLHSPMSDTEVVAQLSEMPLLDKEIIRNQGESLTTLVKPVRRPYWNTSGGSTGVPIRILQDHTYLECSRYITYSQKMQTGFRWGMPWIKIWGDEREIFRGKKTVQQRFADKMKNLQTLNSFRMSDVDKRNIIAKIAEDSPVLVVAYVQSIYELARFARHTGGFSGKVGAIIVSAGTLYPFMRTEIEEIFKAPVFNRYGSREVGNIAIGFSGMTLSKGVWVEVLDDQGKPSPFGVEGEIVVTSLINYAMPLIRYRIGDRGAFGYIKDQSGKDILALERVTGRTVDLFKTPTGASIDGEYFTHLMYYRNWVKQFQFVQRDLDHIDLIVQPIGMPPDDELIDIEQKIKSVMGNSCRVDIEFRDSIVTPDSGKYRYTICEC